MSVDVETAVSPTPHMYLAVHLFRGAKRQVSDPISRRAASDRPAARSNRFDHSRLQAVAFTGSATFACKLVNAARARWEELRLREWKQENRPNEVEKPLTKETRGVDVPLSPTWVLLKSVG